MADPYPAYERLRAAGPVLYDEHTDHWLVPRHADVADLLRDRRFGRTYRHLATHAEMGRPDEPEWHAPFWRLIRAGILDMEPPDHTRVRRLVQRAFTPRTVEALRPRVQAIVDRLADDLAAAGRADLMKTVAEPLPMEVIAELLGALSWPASSSPNTSGSSPASGGPGLRTTSSPHWSRWWTRASA